ncbi:MAG TPA: glycosyltransferase, partial [Candidatus Polarisedimenticolia bacterium]|nr:glycosyltransferase [Candidatus Polarisedimenticolia bacterium]
MTRAARPRPRTCALGIMAYNEGRNIGRLLGALREEILVSCDLQEIVVVASGCTDRTEELVAESARLEPRVRLLRQAKREGQASAVNLFLGAARASEPDLCILMSADMLPQRGALEALVRPLVDTLEAGGAEGGPGRTPRVGMTGARIIPIMGHGTVLGAAAEALARLRHRTAGWTPRLRDLVAFLNVIESVPRDSASAETSLITAITAQGLQVRYIPESVALNRGAATVGEY